MNGNVTTRQRFRIFNVCVILDHKTIAEEMFVIGRTNYLNNDIHWYLIRDWKRNICRWRGIIYRDEETLSFNIGTWITGLNLYQVTTIWNGRALIIEAIPNNPPGSYCNFLCGEESPYNRIILQYRNVKIRVFIHLVINGNFILNTVTVRRNEFFINCRSQIRSQGYFGLNKSARCITKRVCYCQLQGIFLRFKRSYIPVSELAKYRIFSKVIFTSLDTST